MAMSKGFRVFEKKQPNHSIILEHRQRTHEALLFESQAIAVLCEFILNSFHIHFFPLHCICIWKIALQSFKTVR